MERYTIANADLQVSIDRKGAELKSLKYQGKEYLWKADPAFWGRTAPVLFPVVGSFKNKEYRYNGTTYPMGQHGFARDLEFTLVKQREDYLRMALTDSEETRKVYPFLFRLEIAYALAGKSVQVTWRVINTGAENMYFSLGGHPAFLCDQNGCSFRLYRKGMPVEQITCTMLTEQGTAKTAQEDLRNYLTPQGVLPITQELFAEDALILEREQADEVALADAHGREYLRVRFDAPLFGLWSPAGKNAPFVCIEPWYGRCDAEDFNGSLEERAYGNLLHAGEAFEKSFMIDICE